LNQTLSRTIITSGTVFIATLVLFIWGGGAINDFAFTSSSASSPAPIRHLRRERDRAVVAQRRTPEHRRVASDAAKFRVGEGLIFLLNLNRNRNLDSVYDWKSRLRLR